MLLIKYLNPLYHARLYEKSVCGGGRLLIFGIHIFVKGKSTYSHYYCPVGLHSVLRLSEYRFCLFVCFSGSIIDFQILKRSALNNSVSDSIWNNSRISAH